MRPNALSNFARWSARSEEVRIMAEGMHDPTARAMMLRLSADYGRLAERAEGMAALDQPRPSSVSSPTEQPANNPSVSQSSERGSGLV
jgi:hypothetical protein